MRRRFMSLVVVAGLVAVACGGGETTPDAGTPDGGGLEGTTELQVPVPTTGRVYVNLATPAVVTPSGAPAADGSWDLAFEGYDVFTNSGASGAGQGGAFGPLDVSTLEEDAAPTVPFLSTDKAGGAFVDWYAYDSSSHVLYSRFHVYGVKRGTRLWKVQVLSYYGVQDNAPTSALYQVRFAELTSGVGQTQTAQIDGTAGGLSGPEDAPSGCLELASGAVTPLAPSAARSSTGWDLCFRRDAISVNGEAGGPGGVTAVDLDGSQTASEQLADVKARTADSEQAHFDGVTAASFSGATFRGDHIVSMFETGGWLDTSRAPPAPANQAWLVLDASGQRQYLVVFDSFSQATTSSPGTVVMHIKPVNG